MAISHRGSLSNSTASATSLAFSVPAGVAVGDVMYWEVIASTAPTATPTGWVRLASVVPNSATGHVHAVYRRVVTGVEPASYTISFGSLSAIAGGIGAFIGVNNSAPEDDVQAAYSLAQGSTATAPVVTATSTGTAIASSFATITAATISTPAGTTARVAVNPGSVISLLHVDKVQAATGASSPDAAALSGSTYWGAIAWAMRSDTNAPPNAPTGLAPAAATTIDRTAVQRFSWTFTDPTAGDTQSAFDLRYRVSGTTPWTYVSGTTTSAFYDMPASTLAAAAYEWQVRTYDSLGAVGAYSASAFFTAATPAATPTITAPTNGSTVAVQNTTVTWSYPSQQSYQLRRVADNAGVPDTATIYSDTGEVIDTTARSAALALPVNGRWEHVQLRVKQGGLFTAYASVRVFVSYTPPMNPTLVAIASDALARITVTVTNPTGNLLTTNQASLETDTTGWGVGANSTIARTTAQFAAGTASLQMTATAAGNASALTTTTFAAVTPGAVYTAAASFRAAVTGRTVNVAIRWLSSGLGIILDNYGADTADVTTGWVQAQVSAQAPATAAFAQIIVSVVAAAAAEVHYIDAATIYPDTGANLLPNSDFEGTALAPWVLSGAGVTAATTTAQAYTGTRSVLMTGAAGVTGTLVQTLTLTAGVTYTFGVRTYRAAGTGLVRLTMSNANEVAFANADVNTAVGSWQTTTVTFTPTTGAVYVRVLLDAATAVYIDAAQLAVGSSLPAYAPSASNLVSNSSFESNLTGWVNQGSWALTLDATRAAVHGLQVMAVTSTSTSNGGAAFSVPMLSGVRYALSAWVWQTAALGVQILDGNGSGLTGAVTAGSTVGSWVRISGTYVAPSNGTFTFYVHTATPPAAVGTAFYVDAVQAEAGSVATPYFDTTRAGRFELPPPAASSNDLYRRVRGVAGSSLRIARGIAANGSYIDATPQSGVAYEYQALATGSNGASAVSSWAA